MFTCRTEIIRETEMMRAIGINAHILRLICHTFAGRSPVLVLEYCEKADLLTFLRENLLTYKESLSSV